jgi:hypothetical protein
VRQQINNEGTAVVVADANPRMRLCMGRFIPERATAQYDSTHLTSQTRTVDLWSGYRTSKKKHYRTDARSFSGGILSLVRGCVSRHGCAGSRPRMSRPEEGKVIQDLLLELFEVKIDGRSDEKGDELRHNQPADHNESQRPA